MKISREDYFDSIRTALIYGLNPESSLVSEVYLLDGDGIIGVAIIESDWLANDELVELSEERILFTKRQRKELAKYPVNEEVW